MKRVGIVINLMVLAVTGLLAGCAGDGAVDPKSDAGIVSNHVYMNEYISIGDAVGKWDACTKGTRDWSETKENQLRKVTFSCDLRVSGYFKKLSEMAAKDASENFEELMGMKHINIKMVFVIKDKKTIFIDRVVMDYEWLDGTSLLVEERDGSEVMYRAYRNKGIYSPNGIDIVNATDLKLKHKKLREQGIALAKTNKLNTDQNCVGALVLRTKCEKNNT